MGDAVMSGLAVAKATLARLDPVGGVLDTLEVPWNPQGYKLARVAQGVPVAAGLPAGSGLDRFSTELFLDTTEEAGDARNARRIAETLRSWMELLPESLLPPRLLFLWGSLRFAGVIVGLEEEWTRFDPDGTPVRGRLRIELRG